MITIYSDLIYPGFPEALVDSPPAFEGLQSWPFHETSGPEGNKKSGNETRRIRGRKIYQCIILQARGRWAQCVVASFQVSSFFPSTGNNIDWKQFVIWMLKEKCYMLFHRQDPFWVWLRKNTNFTSFHTNPVFFSHPTTTGLAYFPLSAAKRWLVEIRKPSSYLDTEQGSFTPWVHGAVGPRLPQCPFFYKGHFLGEIIANKPIAKHKNAQLELRRCRYS